ncbi:MAG TPA: PfkB family carbohydrate kinase [Myxococcota bacterium]|nr:PfkB family carbohydrate kinase [Myxococcota bacterium]
MSLLVVGSVALDDIEAPAGSAKGVLGGAASYFGVSASYFVPVRVVAVVGEDFPREHVDFLASKGLDLTGLQRVPGRTFRWGGRYRKSLNERDTLFTELGVFADFDPKIPPAYRDSEWVFLANIQPTLQRNVLEQTRAPRFSAMDTMNFWIEGARDELAKTLAVVKGLVINDEEARQLTGQSNLVLAADAIRELGPRVVIVKRGEHGALLFDDDGIFAAPAFPLRDVRDPTGAGDAFAGGLMGALASQGDLSTAALRRAMIYGSVLASFCVERFSLDRLRDLTRADIDDRFEEFRRLTTF